MANSSGLQFPSTDAVARNSGVEAGQSLDMASQMATSPEDASLCIGLSTPHADNYDQGASSQDEKNSINRSDAGSGERSDGASVDTAFTETTNIPRRSLGTMDVASLIINQMVGTGIFVTPGLVLSMTKSKPISLVLWAMGGIWSFLCIAIYIEFGAALPYTGGAMIYLGEVFPRPKMLSTVIVSLFMIFFLNSGNNCVIFGQYVLRLAKPGESKSDFDERLVIFLAVVTQSTICLLLYFTSQLAMLMNKTFAIFKVALFLAIIIAGVCARNKQDSGLKNFNTQQPNPDKADVLGAMIYIILSYQGWENANYVAGEIKAPRKTLRLGLFIGVTVVTVSYLLVNVAYFVVLDYGTIVEAENGLGIAVQFAQTAFGNATGIETAVALSALGNILAVTWTNSKVKRAIALQGFIPFYKFFGAIDKQFGTPGGALVLQWLFSVILISWSPKNKAYSGFSLGIFNYGNLIVMFFVGLGLMRLRHRMKTVNPDWKPSFLTTRISESLVAFLFCGMNMTMIVNTALPKEQGQVAAYWFPIVMAVVVGFCLVYWGCIQLLHFKWGDHPTMGSRIGIEVTVYDGDDEDVPDSMRGLIREASLDGSRHRLEWKISGPLDAMMKWPHTCMNFLSRHGA